MGKLIYSAIGSLDGYVADRERKFGWAAPGEDVHRVVNDLVRPVSTFLLGRRTYEVLLAWETMKTDGEPAVIRDFAGIWRGLDKVVYSRTLEKVSSARTRAGTRALPDDVRVGLELVEERRFGDGVVYLHYRTRGS